ncbi:peptide deformylase [Actinoallomurus rhizosphaericola]|uniref:peptide deformylase n=1 Tax=Actinoallomurus rhizosphaericola TaxID=2952536 RepID=UPI002090D836|nr:peptide deformylase [Actinoallomurus rhizosphaericola]MCO5993113.1 peptide deformylase [Actinoallomurus rhizosphaericola]
MTVQPVRLFDDPILRKPAMPVVDFDAELRTLIADLTETMNQNNGAGLAAPQIGVSLRVFTFNESLAEGELGHLVNPVLEFPDEEEQDGPEGCLSIPGIYLDTKRRMNVVAKGYTAHGDPVQIVGSGMLARCVQHETDHLDGVLFLDRADPERRARTLQAIRSAGWFDEAEPPVVKLDPHG